jgi:Rhomboid family
MNFRVNCSRCHWLGVFLQGSGRPKLKLERVGKAALTLAGGAAVLKTSGSLGTSTRFVPTRVALSVSQGLYSIAIVLLVCFDAEAAVVPVIQPARAVAQICIWICGSTGVGSGAHRLGCKGELIIRTAVLLHLEHALLSMRVWKLSLLSIMQYNPAIAAGQWWRLITPALLHANLVHLVVNCHSLNSLGPTVESISGHARFAAVCFVSAVSGTLCSYCFSSAPSVGASGRSCITLSAWIAIMSVSGPMSLSVFGLILQLNVSTTRDVCGRHGVWARWCTCHIFLQTSAHFWQNKHERIEEHAAKFSVEPGIGI